jgi:hypothetical protein
MALPRKELKTAKRLLRALTVPEDAPLYTFPYDDEPIDEEERRAIEEGRKAIAEGRTIPLHAVMEKYGI